jgi:hypothetical protein
MRTICIHNYLSEKIVRLSIQDQRDSILSKSKPSLLLNKLLATKFQQSQSNDQQPLAP